MMAPNGMALTRDGSPGRRRIGKPPRLSRFTVTADGELRDRTLVPLEKAHGVDYVTPDGICLDADGAVWAADPMGGRVIRVLTNGEIERVIVVDDGYGPACILGGSDRRTLFRRGCGLSAWEAPTVRNGQGDDCLRRQSTCPAMADHEREMAIAIPQVVMLEVQDVWR